MNFKFMDTVQFINNEFYGSYIFVVISKVNDDGCYELMQCSTGIPIKIRALNTELRMVE